MRKEVKLNLLFFGLLIPLMAPGFVILIKKKLNDPTKPSFGRESVPVSSAYNQPPPVNPRLPRVEPSEARQWVTQLVQDRLGTSTTLVRISNGSAPPMGDAFCTQLLTTTPSLCLLLWTAREDVSASNPQVTLIAGDQRSTLAEVNAERVDVPKTVRHALQKVGYLDPPERVWLLKGATSMQTPSSLQIAFDGQAKIETVTIASP